jgi:hypothetical protein
MISTWWRCPWYKGEPRSYGSWIYNYLCNQCLSPLRWGVLDTTLCDKVCQWHTTGRWFSPGTPVSSINKTDRNDITEILLKVTLKTINQTTNLGTKEKTLDKTNKCLVKVGWSGFSFSVHTYSCITVTGRHFIGKNGVQFEMLQCFCNDLQFNILIAYLFQSCIKNISKVFSKSRMRKKAAIKYC